MYLILLTHMNDLLCVITRFFISFYHSQPKKCLHTRQFQFSKPTFQNVRANTQVVP